MRSVVRLAQSTVLLIFSLGLACTPSPPTNPFFLAVRVETASSSQVILVNEKGELVTRLPSGSTSPAFSSDDGLFYASLTQIGGDIEAYQIYRLDLDTRETIRLSDGTGNDESPVCSPDAKHVAFISYQVPVKENGDTYWRIWLMTPDGKDRRLLDPKEPTVQFAPSWSPDGKKIVYNRRSSMEQAQEEKTIQSTLRVYDLATQTGRNLLPGDHMTVYPTWSPQGDLIAFTMLDKATGKGSIWVVQPDGTGMRRLTSDHNDIQASWSPDGKNLIFIRQQENQSVICEVNLATLKVDSVLEKPLQKVIKEILADEDTKDIKLMFPRLYFLPQPETQPDAKQKSS